MSLLLLQTYKVFMTVHFLINSKNNSLQRLYSYCLNFPPNFAAWCQRPVLPSAGVTKLWHLKFTAVPIRLVLLSCLHLYIVKNMYIYIYIYIYISDCVQTVYELPLLPNNTAVKHFYINRERCEILTGYLSLGLYNL